MGRTGQAGLGTFGDGGIRKCEGPRCVYVGWPALWFAYLRPNMMRTFWHGSLLEDKQDATGTQYRRNRYYDPATGRFTQEDPIGLAGGLNLYGFANGDPVNYSDPFGLQACPKGQVPVGETCAVAVGFPSWIGGPATKIGGGIKHLMRRGSAAISAMRGALRERRVASLVGGVVSGQRVTVAGVGSTDVDVIGAAGEFIPVGGPAKAIDLADFGHRLNILRQAAEAEGTVAKAYLARGTPESAIRIATRHLGLDNVVIF